jgi:hypothetical protein
MQAQIDCISVYDRVTLHDKTVNNLQQQTYIIRGNGCPKNRKPVALRYH